MGWHSGYSICCTGMGARARNPRNHVKCVTSTEKLDLELGDSSEVQRLASLEYTVAEEKMKTGNERAHWLPHMSHGE